MLKEDVACFNVRILSDIIMEELRTTTEAFNEGGQSWSRHFNPEPARTLSNSANHPTAMLSTTIKDTLKYPYYF
jgi:hypothetical protein